MIADRIEVNCSKPAQPMLNAMSVSAPATSCGWFGAHDSAHCWKIGYVSWLKICITCDRVRHFCGSYVGVSSHVTSG